MAALIAKFMGPTWGPSGADRTQVGPMFAPWTLLSGCWCPDFSWWYPGSLGGQLIEAQWGVTHICISKLTIIGSDNGLSPGPCQAIVWTYDGILLTGPLRTNFNEILIEIDTFSFKKMHLKMLSAKWRPFCLCLNVLTTMALTIQLKQLILHYDRFPVFVPSQVLKKWFFRCLKLNSTQQWLTHWPLWYEDVFHK